MPAELHALGIFRDERMNEILGRAARPVRYSLAQRVQELRDRIGGIQLVLVVVIPAHRN